MTIYDIPFNDAHDEPTSLAQYKGIPILIINTASNCGYTPQFEGLEKLYQTYKEQGLVVVGFPCNQFGNQDPGSTDDSIKVCRENYGVSFPMMAKIDVNGPDTAPLFAYLKEQKKGTLGKRIKWNFTKFLVDQNGTVVKRYGSSTEPERIGIDIQKLLRN